ncbi:ExeM/NucH family extracellular endonuclease [Intrasporangium sp. YIM S08009]|uniref:ExeM/NucH family extracellular endonuclease n=1 Tax=Intrasporangium zincisolvens TaxID=3080018 RepID=UPI002B0542A4|nr:ExeM/NucH family extracellular endonuclease [Intrasporangium sp. YIM S08009]
MLSSRPTVRRVAGATATALAVGVVPFVVAPSASAAPTELFISEYVEGTSNNKALEVYNGTGAPVDLTAGGYNVQVFANGAAAATSTTNLTGTVANGDVFVLANPSANAAILSAADLTSGNANWNGDDAVVLRKGTTVLDVFGQVGFRPVNEWGTGLTSTMDNTLRRKASVQVGDPNGSDAFDPSVEWDGYAVDTVDGLGAHSIDSGPAPDAAPTVTATTPADGASGIAPTAPLSVTFSEPVTAGAGAFSLVCTTGGTRALTVAGGPTAYTLTPTAPLVAGDSCTLTVSAAAVSDVDAVDPPDTMAADKVVRFTTAAANPCEAPITPIYEIQGSGPVVTRTGTVTTRGVVVGDYEGASPNLRGFFLQDPVGDDDPATSDGIFVFEGSNANAVKLGDLVTVTGTAAENQGQSQISVGTVTVCASDQTVAPTDVAFPVADDTTLERYEGMLVRVPQPMSVTEHFQLGRFGQVTLSADGRLAQPTNVVAPGAAAAALQTQNNLRKIVLDDASQAQNPDPIVFARGGQPLTAANTLRGGDTVTNLTGVLNYTWGGNASSPNAYRIRPIGALGGQARFEAVNERPASAPAVGGHVRVVGMNLLNFFNTLDTTGNNCRGGVIGAVMDCRGANTTTEFDRQWHKTVTAVSGTGADVVAFMEMENDGYGTDSAERFLVDRLNEKDGAGTWAFIDADARTGQVDAMGTDAIKVGMLYKPAAVTPVGTTAALNTDAFVTGGDSGPRNRPSLAQAFRDNTTGGVFVAVANHLKSKGSACDSPDTGDGQGNCAAVRTKAAQLLSDWLATDPTKTGDDDVLLLGDMNSYAKEDPIAMFEGKGFTNLIAARNGAEAYSYVFDGQWGYLDHALGSASLSRQVTGVADWHVNADEPSVLDYNTEFKSANQVASLYSPDQFRISDHDPVVVGLDLANAAPVVTSVTGPSDATSVGATAAVSASFTDADALDTHTATIAWGDGSTTAAPVTGGTVSGGHVYAAAGVYTVTVTVSDEWGHSGSGTTTVVVYDRAAGFLTGGGWFTSPKGAVAGDPSATGKAQFQVSAQYASGASRPAGSFTLATPGLTLASTGLDWLVVTGDTARLAGQATVGGAPGYRFEVTATDAATDTLRVVVRDASGAVVYDGGTQRVQGQVKVH